MSIVVILKSVAGQICCPVIVSYKVLQQKIDVILIGVVVMKLLLKMQSC